jgi:hypothetical protein
LSNECKFSKLLHILIAQIQSREISSLASLWPNENTAILATFKISLALDRSIVLARGLIERDSNPSANTRNLGNCTDVGDRASTSVRFG